LIVYPLTYTRNFNAKPYESTVYTAVLDGWKPKIVPGGFAGHCVNNDAQRYRYAPDPNGAVHTARLRKDGSYRTSSGERVIAGRSQFHDYNF
jgi:hypothetical protein